MSQKRPVAAVFIHGLAKKPPVEKLKEIWMWGLGRDNPMPDVFAPPNAGVNLATKGVPQFFNYYADVFYGVDYETDINSYYEANADLETAADGVNALESGLQLPQGTTPRERTFLRNFQAKMAASAAMTSSPAEGVPVTVMAGGENFEIASWLPDSVKQVIIKKAAMEAYYFLFDKEYVRSDKVSFMVRQELRSRLLGELAAASAVAEKVIVLSHSMGTMVAYDVLRNCPDCPKVDTLFTLGSPLGIQEVQDELVAVGAEQVDFPAARVNRWINIYDPLDPVCGADPRFSNDFVAVDGKRVEDVKESNWGSWRHTITHYFAGTELRKRLIQAIS